MKRGPNQSKRSIVTDSSALGSWLGFLFLLKAGTRCRVRGCRGTVGAWRCCSFCRGGEGGDEPREHSAIHAGRGLVGLPGKAAGKGGVAARGGRVIRGGAGSRVGSDSRGSSGIGTTPGKRSPSCILSADRCRHVPCTIFRARATPPHLILLIPAVTPQPLICPLVPDRPCPPSSPTPPFPYAPHIADLYLPQRYRS